MVKLMQVLVLCYTFYKLKFYFCSLVEFRSYSNFENSWQPMAISDNLETFFKIIGGFWQLDCNCSPRSHVSNI